MSKRSLLAMTLSLVIVSTIPTMVNAQSGAASRSIELGKMWQSLAIKTPGVHVHDNTVFVMVSRPWGLSNGSEHRRWATPIIGQFLYQWAAELSGVSATEKRLLFASGSLLSVTGRSLYSGKDGDNFVAVYAFDKSVIDTKIKTIDFKKKAMAAAQSAIADPQNNILVFENNRFDEVALLASLKAYNGKLFSVSAPVTKLRVFSSVSRTYYEARDALIEISAPPISNVQLYKAAWNCVDNAEEFHTQLGNQNIALLPTNSRNPIMSQVNSCQGFVTFDQQLSDKEPVMMARIKAQFAKGADLELATYLLEQAVEEAPRNPEVWEYLTAAYEAANNHDAAKLASRVWFLLDKSNSKEVFFKVFSQNKNTGSEQYQYFLQFE